MKRNYYDIIEYKTWKAHCKTEALRYLFDHFQETGTSERDSEARAGICYILEEISNEMRSAHNLLSDVKRPPLDTEVEDPDGYIKGYPEDNIELPLKLKTKETTAEN